jgi:hypothetical protein
MEIWSDMVIAFGWTRYAKLKKASGKRFSAAVDFCREPPIAKARHVISLAILSDFPRGLRIFPRLHVSFPLFAQNPL